MRMITQSFFLNVLVRSFEQSWPIQLDEEMLVEVCDVG